MKKLGLTLATCLVLWAAGIAQAQVNFQGLGFLPGGAILESSGYGVSADGKTVVGQSTSTNGRQAFRWTQGTGMVGLNDFATGAFQSLAYSPNPDGSVIVGFGTITAGQQAFRWTQGTGLQPLTGIPVGFTANIAVDVSDDGNVISGWGTNASLNQEAFRWTSGGGLTPLGDLPGGGFYSVSVRATPDGSALIGFGLSATGFEAMRWTLANGMEGLGFLPGGTDSRAWGLSADGKTVVGNADNGSGGTEAYIWRESDGVLNPLGDLPGGAVLSRAYDATWDGSVAVGLGTTAIGEEAMLWTASLGMVNLKQYLLTNFASSLPGDFNQWTLTEARAIAHDGTAIVGYGINPQGQREAWRIGFAQSLAPAPEPSTGYLLLPVAVIAATVFTRSRRTQEGNA